MKRNEQTISICFRIGKTISILFLCFFSLPIIWYIKRMLPKTLGTALLIILLIGFVSFLVKTYNRELKIENTSLKSLYGFFWSFTGILLMFSILFIIGGSDVKEVNFFAGGVFTFMYYITLPVIIYKHTKEKKWIIFIRHLILSSLLIFCIQMILPKPAFFDCEHIDITPNKTLQH